MIARGNTLVSVGAVLLLAAAASSCGEGTAPPKPTTMIFVTAPPTTAETMVPLTTQPVVQTVDANGNPAGGVTTITVTATGANGVVAANGTATTDKTGRATFSNLTLGSNHGVVGPLTLEFDATGLQPIYAPVELHCAVLPLTIGQNVSRSLSDGDCTFANGVYENIFALTTAQAVSAVRLALSGSFLGTLLLRGPNEPLFFWGYGAATGSPNNGIAYKVLLPSGRNLIAVASQGQLGAYSMTANSAPEDLTCEDILTFAASPITTAQQLNVEDCVENSFLEDGLGFGLPTNATINATMSSSAFDPQIKVINMFTQAVVTSSTAPASTSVTFTNTDPDPTPYILVLTSSASDVSGPYNLTMNITYPASVTAPRASLTLPKFEPRPSSAMRRPPWAGGRRVR